MIDLITVPENVWLEATWEEFLALADDPKRVSDRFYYHQGCLKIESPSCQSDGIFSILIILYAMSRDIPVKGLMRGSFRKADDCEFQPNLAFYVGESLTFPPRSHLPINLNETPPPTLIVEISANRCREDCDRKTALYQQAGVSEQWMIDVNLNQIFAFTLSANQSVPIRVSQVLPGLEMATVEEALRRSQTEDDGAIGRWLLTLFSQ
ncbi:Uma2 family endonuclease [Phormidesmis sp. 146-35]